VIESFFQGLSDELPKDCAFDLPHCAVFCENVCILWTAESETIVCDFAADTFTIKDGRITLQTIGFVKRSK